MKIFVDRAYPAPAIDKMHHGCCSHTGAAFYPKSEVGRLARRAVELDIATAIHGMGNCAVNTVMDAYENSRRGRSSDAVLRLEHAFVAEPAQAPRMADLGIDLVANPGLGLAMGRSLRYVARRVPASPQVVSRQEHDRCWCASQSCFGSSLWQLLAAGDHVDCRNAYLAQRYAGRCGRSHHAGRSATCLYD